MVRNAAIAAGNSGNPAYRERLRELTADPNPVVAEAASWALHRIAERITEVTLPLDVNAPEPEPFGHQP